jgi:hypothetical protein
LKLCGFVTVGKWCLSKAILIYVLSHTIKKLSLFYDNNENNPDMLDAMTENLRKLGNIIDQSSSPNSFSNKQT